MSGTMGELNDLNMFNVSSRYWVWIGGASDFNSAGTYPGSKVPAVGGWPPGRHDYALWGDRTQNRFYIFGGAGSSPAPSSSTFLAIYG